MLLAEHNLTIEIMFASRENGAKNNVTALSNQDGILSGDT